MTKKDFELIAAAFRTARGQIPESGDSLLTTGEALGQATVARILAWDLAKTNPRFDRARFLVACGVTS